MFKTYLGHSYEIPRTFVGNSQELQRNSKGNSSEKYLGKEKPRLATFGKKLENFWKHSNTDNRVKLQVYNAVITSRLLYGLESANLTPGLKNSLDVFQARGIRQILKLDTTWAQIKNGKKADNTLKQNYKEASKILNPRTDTINYWRYFWDKVESTIEESTLMKNIKDALISPEPAKPLENCVVDS